jgi:hypothetical protein
MVVPTTFSAVAQRNQKKKESEWRIERDVKKMESKKCDRRNKGERA